MRTTWKVTSLLTAATILGIAACGDDAIDILPNPDAGQENDSGPRKDSEPVDSSAPVKDATPDAPDDSIKKITLAVEDVIAKEAPKGPSSFGFASSQDAYGGAGTSWRFQKPLTGAADEKFEFYLPFTADDAKDKAAGLGEISAHLGKVTVADIASIKVRSRRNDADTRDFMMIVYTVPHTTAAENDASWYARRLHASFEWADSLNAPASTWNTFSTAAGANALRFWDFRNSNTGAGEQPSDNYFSLEDMQKGAVTPAGVTGARDYRTEQIRYISFSSNSSEATFDGSIDGIEIVLKNGKGVSIDLAGDAKFRRVALSQSKLLAVDVPDDGSTYGTTTTAGAWGGAGTSWSFIKNAATNEKLEFYLTFAGALDTPKTEIWKGVRDHLGEFTIADLDSLRVHSKKKAADRDFMAIIYTVADNANDDASWYGMRLHAQLAWAKTPNAPVDTWNTFSTAAGANQLQFWDFRNSNAGAGEQPSGSNYFTLADMQAGPVTPAGITVARDYRTEKVKYVSFSTSSSETEFEGSIDGIEVRLKNGKILVVDLDK